MPGKGRIDQKSYRRDAKPIRCPQQAGQPRLQVNV
jgi:hypothetical protein